MLLSPLALILLASISRDHPRFRVIGFCLLLLVAVVVVFVVVVVVVIVLVVAV